MKIGLSCAVAFGAAPTIAAQTDRASEKRVKSFADAFKPEDNVTVVLRSKDASKVVYDIAVPEWPKIVVTIALDSSGKGRAVRSTILLPGLAYLSFEDINQFNVENGVGRAVKLPNGSAELSVVSLMTSTTDDFDVSAEAVGFVRILLADFVKLTNAKYR